MENDWKDKILEFCEKYNIPLLYIAETMYEPKVVPMIRGKAFEFSVMIVLQEILPKEDWIIDKPVMNAQSGFHDVDVRVVHKPSKKIVRVECKLAKKASYRQFSDNHIELRVKCMRSRTLGTAKVKELAPKLKVRESVLSIHNDQYLPADFDIVVSSIGNAFYRTDEQTGQFEWAPTKEETEFLQKLNPLSKTILKDFAFRTMYVAKTQDIAISKHNNVKCTRGKCRNKNNCGFIPNYPIIKFDLKTNRPSNGWVPIEESLSLFEDFVSS